eukprot:g4788.t1
MAGLRLYHLHPRTGGELEQRSVGILVNSDAGIFRTGRRDFSGHAVVDHKHPRLAKLESHTVGIVNSGRGEAKWIGKGIVRVKPWKAHGTDFEGAGSHQFEEYSYWRGEALFETDPEPFFLWWSSYLEGYANAEQTGEVVEFLPPGTFAGLPPGPGNHQGDGGYLVRFPLPALPWTPDGHLRIGEPGAEEVGSDEELPLGGWRLTPATRLPNGQNVLLLEVPRSRLYVDVAAHTDDRRQTNGNPFETVPVLTP